MKIKQIPIGLTLKQSFVQMFGFFGNGMAMFSWKDYGIGCAVVIEIGSFLAKIVWRLHSTPGVRFRSQRGLNLEFRLELFSFNNANSTLVWKTDRGSPSVLLQNASRNIGNLLL